MQYKKSISSTNKCNSRLVILGIWLMAILTALPVGPAYSFEEVRFMEGSNSWRGQIHGVVRFMEGSVSQEGSDSWRGQIYRRRLIHHSRGQIHEEVRFIGGVRFLEGSDSNEEGSTWVMFEGGIRYFFLLHQRSFFFIICKKNHSTF